MRNKLIAYTVGAACHALFLAAITLMAFMLFEGLTTGIFPTVGYGRLLNILLILQFPLGHSFFLSKRGRRLMELPFPKEIAKDMSTTAFSILSSTQLLFVFLFWTPTATVWFAPTGALLYLWILAYVASWLLLVKALSEAGMALHSGALGWRAVVRGQKPSYPKMCKNGLHALCRHPIYLAFSLIILTAPIWGLDHAILAFVWVAYCLVGPRLKERRLLKTFKNEYQEFQRTTPYMIPRISLNFKHKHPAQ